jgi:predicted DCC family thiol-disulfide oxidoreductase YuxK
VYDGDCGICRDLVGRVRQRDRAGRFRFVPYQDEAALRATGVTREQATHAMYLVTDEGVRWSGGQAVARVIEDLPRGRFVGRVMRLPVLRQLLGLGYRLVADNRHSVSRLAGDGCDVAAADSRRDA